MSSTDNEIEIQTKKGGRIEMKDHTDTSEKDDDIKFDSIDIKHDPEHQDEMFLDEGQFKTSEFPKKIIVLPVFLLLCGLLLIGLGLGALFNHEGTSKTISFLVFGGIVLIPGLYYTFQLILACRADTTAERDEILAEFPI